MWICAFSIVHPKPYKANQSPLSWGDPTLLQSTSLECSPRQGWCNQHFISAEIIQGTAWEAKNLGYKVVGNCRVMNLQIHFVPELKLSVVLGFFARIVLNHPIGSFMMPPSHAEAVIPGEQELPSSAPGQGGAELQPSFPPKEQLPLHPSGIPSLLWLPTHTSASWGMIRLFNRHTFSLFSFKDTPDYFQLVLRVVSCSAGGWFKTGSLCAHLCVRREKGWNECEKSNQQ